jgi:hypothetical protein
MESLNEQIIISEKKYDTKEKEFNGSVNGSVGLSALITVLKGNVSYGRKGIIQHETEVKQSYANRLTKVVETLSPLCDIREILRNNEDVDNTYYFYEGLFSVENPINDYSENQIITITSSIYLSGREYNVMLDCSLKYFSEMSENGKYELHSSNYSFFKGRVKLKLSTVILLQQVEGDIIFGSPLYLLMSDDSKII